jgi:deoxyadenosine/deoxycytidine kinase
MSEEEDHHPNEAPEPIAGRIGIVGPCAAGKSTLMAGLRRLGFDAHQCAQEHSAIPDMWRRLTRPAVLVYLDASLAAARQRRAMRLRGTDRAAQGERLAHARRHCHIYVDTDPLTAPEVLAVVARALGPWLGGYTEPPAGV